MRNFQLALIGLIFALSGVLHFAKPKFYEEIVPPYLPAGDQLVRISGVFEILGALGILVPASRKASGWGLIALLLAVFPANVYMATDPKFADVAPRWALLGRLPLQFVLIWWIHARCIAPDRSQ